jgi:SulP family sulfate permease
MAGILLTITAFAGIGEQVHRLPTAVVEGFTAGLAIVIALQQFPFIFGVQPSDSEKVYLKAGEAIASATFEASTAPVLIAIGVAAAILLVSKFAPKVPTALIMVFVATLAANAFGLSIERIGDIPSRIGNFDLGFLHFESWWTLIPSAVAVAVLAALESLLSAKVADQMRGGGERHDSNRELFGQGLANIVVPFLGGVPATAALARTAVNVRSGASSKLAALSHSAILAAVILFLAPVVAQIPLAALGGVLIATCVHMIKPSELLTIARDSWLDVILLVVTFALTIFVDMITAILIGILLALILRRTPLAKKLDRRYPPIDEKETLGD